MQAFQPAASVEYSNFRFFLKFSWLSVNSWERQIPIQNNFESVTSIQRRIVHGVHSSQRKEQISRQLEF